MRTVRNQMIDRQSAVDYRRGQKSMLIVIVKDVIMRKEPKHSGVFRGYRNSKETANDSRRHEELTQSIKQDASLVDSRPPSSDQQTNSYQKA